MSPVQFYNGKPLFVDGKVAWSTDCCCDDDPPDPPENICEAEFVVVTFSGIQACNLCLFPQYMYTDVWGDGSFVLYRGGPGSRISEEDYDCTFTWTGDPAQRDPTPGSLPQFPDGTFNLNEHPFFDSDCSEPVVANYNKGFDGVSGWTIIPAVGVNLATGSISRVQLDLTYIGAVDRPPLSSGWMFDYAGPSFGNGDIVINGIDVCVDADPASGIAFGGTAQVTW